jgi:hypothetical protein
VTFRTALTAIMLALAVLAGSAACTSSGTAANAPSPSSAAPYSRPVPQSPQPMPTPELTTSCTLGFDGGIEDLMPLSAAYESYQTGEQVFITNSSATAVTLYGIMTEIIYEGQVTSTSTITSTTIDGSPGGAPGYSLPWYLPPGQTFHPVIDLATSAPPGDEIHVSWQTYLGSSCKVTGWF